MLFRNDMKRVIAWTLLTILLAGGCGRASMPPTPAPTAVAGSAESTLPLTLVSPAFSDGGEIPLRYTCFGENLSPPLRWSNVPAGTQSLALLMHDPDSSPPGFIHWVVYDVAPDADGLPEGVSPGPRLPDGIRQGTNDFAAFSIDTFPGGSPVHRIGYDGPCPPARHRYVFTLYALDTPLNLEPGASAAELTHRMEGHILARAELVGRFTPPE